MVCIHVPHHGRRGRNPGLVKTCFALSILVIAGLVWWNNGLRDQFFPKNFGVVEAGVLYRSGRLQPEMIRRVVREHSIRTIIDLGADRAGTPPDLAAAKAAEELGVRRVRFNALRGDGTGDPNDYAAALRLMLDPANRPVLVQCGAGAQRTSVACALYEHLAHGVPIADALKKAERHRFDPAEDKPAIDYVAKWGGAIEQAARDGGTIDTGASP